MEHYISVYWKYWLLQTILKRRVKLSQPTAVWCLYDCSIPHQSLVKNKWRGLVFILLYVAYKRGHSVFDNAVKTTVLYIQRIDLMSLSHRLVKLTRCQALFSTRYFIIDVCLKTQFIFLCCAKIFTSGAWSNHCAIQGQLFNFMSVAYMHNRCRHKYRFKL